MKRFVTSISIAIIALALTVSVAGAKPPANLHCPDGGTKIEAISDELNGIVLPAGTSFCVKGSTENTGILVSDGTTTLFDYLGNDHDVSYYVVYEQEVTPSPTPTTSTTESPLPSSTPSSTPTATATPQATQTATPQATETATVSASITPEVIPPTPIVTILPDTAASQSEGLPFLALASVLLLGLGIFMVADNLSKRR